MPRKSHRSSSTSVRSAPVSQATRAAAPQSQGETSSGAQSQDPPRSSYHHYLPRFVARGWVQEVRHTRSRKGKRPMKKEVAHSYDMESDTLHTGATDIGKTFGVADMYRDESDLKDVEAIEKAFSKLESNAARVIAKLDAAVKNGRTTVEIVRSELNTLRKFLSLLHYRNGSHAAQFIRGYFDPMTAAMVEKYRDEHNLRDARSVWLYNIKCLLEKEHWEIPEDQRLLWTTREDYRMEAYSMQLGLYKAPPEVEFILTENGLGLAEGTSTPFSPLVMAMSPGAGGPPGREALSFFPLTMTFAVTPTLVIILRSTFLTREQGALDYGLSPAEAHASAGRFGTPSYFEDIPRTPPKTTYYPPISPEAYNFMELRTERDRQLAKEFEMKGKLNGVHMGSRVRDRFIFTIDTLNEDQAQRVNTLMLTHCYETICYVSPNNLLQSIEAFERDKLLFKGTGPAKRRFNSLRTKLQALLAPETDTVTSVVSNDADALQAISPSSARVSIPTLSSKSGPSVEQSIPTQACSPVVQSTDRDVPPPGSQVNERNDGTPRPRRTPETGTAVEHQTHTPDHDVSTRMKTSLPGLRGAFQRRKPETRNSVPSKTLPLASLEEDVANVVATAPFVLPKSG